MMQREPHDEVLLALGRMTWNAINLEDRTYSVGELVLAKSCREMFISKCITGTKESLSRWPQDPLVTAAIEWLNDAHAALTKRNEVLHSVPVTLYEPNEGGGLRRIEDALDHFPIKGESYVRHSLRATELDAVGTQIRSVVERWREVIVALFDIQAPRPAPAEPTDLPQTSGD